MRRGVWDLRIFQDVRYPLIIDEIATAIAAVMPKNKVRAIPKGGYVQISSYSKAWPCLFPQAGRDGCDLIGVEYRNNRANSISVARRDSVAKLDAIVGPKR
jgi:hypothetical protein